MAGSEYYDHSTFPAFNSPGSSASMRSELDKIEAGFDKCPTLAGNGSKFVRIKADTSGMESVAAIGGGSSVVTANGTVGSGNSAVFANAVTGSGSTAVFSTDPTFTLTDTTTNNASTLAHGWMQKYPGNAALFLNGAGAFAAPVGNNLVLSSRTANTQIVAADVGQLIDITSGTFTQTFAAASALGSGFYVFLRNSGTGDITLDPDSTELIDGLSSYVMYEGECRLVQCDGIKLTTVILTPFSKTFTASGTFTRPPGYRNFGYAIWGGGGSGRKDSGANNKLGGGGAPGAEGILTAAQIGTSIAITVGAGGAAQTVNATNGNAGGASSIGSIISMPGGVAGTGVATLASASAYFAGLSFGNTNVLASGTGAATPSFYGGGAPTTIAGDSRTVWGGAAGGSITAGDVLVNDSVTIHGGARGDAALATSGVDGVAPGAGGGATKTGAQSGAGARGEVRIWGGA